MSAKTSFARSTAVKALLLAGLSILRPLPAEEIPARRVMAAPTPTALASPTPLPLPTATPVPSVRPEQLEASEAKLRAEAESLYRKSAEIAELLRKDLAALGDKIDALGRAQQRADARQDKAEMQGKSMQASLEESQKRLDEGLKAVEAVRGQIENKALRMEGLLDLTNTLKRDLNDNSHEIAEAKRDIAALSKSAQQPASEEDGWTQFATWRYLPAVAVVLGAVAIGIASSK